MTVDDYSSGLNVRRHQNKLGTAISDSGTGGPRRRQPTEEVEHAAPVHFWSTFAACAIARAISAAPSTLVRCSSSNSLARCSWRHCWRIRFTSQLTSCCSRMTLLQPEGMAGQANQSCHPWIQYSRAARRPPARFCVSARHQRYAACDAERLHHRNRQASSQRHRRMHHAAPRLWHVAIVPGDDRMHSSAGAAARTMRKTKHRGIASVATDFMLNPIA